MRGTSKTQIYHVVQPEGDLSIKNEVKILNQEPLLWNENIYEKSFKNQRAGTKSTKKVAKKIYRSTLLCEQ